jgi:hypothetical protein
VHSKSWQTDSTSYGKRIANALANRWLTDGSSSLSSSSSFSMLLLVTHAHNDALVAREQVSR